MRTEGDSPARLLAPIRSGRLAYDPSVSTESPVVRGTRFTTFEVIGRMSYPDRWCVDAIREHYRITAEDFLACRDYEAEANRVRYYNDPPAVS